MGSDEKIQNTAKFSKKTPTVLLFIFLIVEKKKDTVLHNAKQAPPCWEVPPCTSAGQHL